MTTLDAGILVFYTMEISLFSIKESLVTRDLSSSHMMLQSMIFKRSKVMKLKRLRSSDLEQSLESILSSLWNSEKSEIHLMSLNSKKIKILDLTIS